MSTLESDTRPVADGGGERLKVLVKEKVGDSGVRLLQEHFDVDLGIDWSEQEFEQRIGDYHGILIRSATKMTAELIAKATNMRVIGRAGVGVDNVDVDAATQRGIVVANAPQSNVVTAAEHTMALLLALARNIPQAQASLKSGKWERSKFSGVELYEKTLGIVGFGRIGQLVAQRARGFGMRCSPLTPTSRLSATASWASRRPPPQTRCARRPISSPSTCPRRLRLKVGWTRPSSPRCATVCASSTWPAAA